MRSTSYRPEIDGLRAIAVLAVILFHFNSSLLPGGYMGVDVFFVISGYLITALIKKDIDNNQFKLSEFYLRRIKRIIPALYILLLVVTVVAVLILLPTDLKDYGRSLLSQSLFSSNIYFYFKSDYFDTPSLLKPILHTWSLSVEEQFYIFYPILLVMLFKLSRKYTVCILLLLFLLSLTACYCIYDHNQNAVFYLSPFRSWQLILGAMLNFVPVKAKPLNKSLAGIIAWIGLLAIFYSFVFLSKNVPMHGMSSIIPTIGTALMIIGNSNKITSAGLILTNRPVNFTGRISYSLYLWHWPLIVFYTYVLGDHISVISGCCIFAANYLLAFLSYRYIETPFRHTNFLKKPLAFFLLTIAGAVFFLVAGYMINSRNGLPGRFSPAIKKMLLEAAERPGCMPRIVYNRHHEMKYINRCDTDQVTSPGILVWGDSHSGMLQPVLKVLSDKYKEKFAFYNCPSALNVFLAYKDPSYEKSPCYQSNKEIISFIKNNHIKCVLFASSWSQYTEGRELKMEGAGENDKLYADSLTTHFSTDDAKRVFQSKITYTVNLLTRLNVDVWIMEQVPQHEFWAPNEIAKRKVYNQDTTRIGRVLSDHLKRQSFVNGIFKQLNKDKHVHLLDPAPYFITGKNFLTVYKNGKSLYLDYNHLSVAGTHLLEPMFIPLFESLKTHQ